MGKLKAAIALIILATTGLLASMSFEQYLSASQPFLASPTRLEAIVHVTPAEAYELIQAHQENPNFVILDVRTPEEFTAGHIVAARNINFYGERFHQEIRQLNPQHIYLIYCQQGVRSDRSLQMMQQMGFEHVHNLLGGFSRWQREGFDTVS